MYYGRLSYPPISRLIGAKYSQIKHIHSQEHKKTKQPCKKTTMHELKKASFRGLLCHPTRKLIRLIQLLPEPVWGSTTDVICSQFTE